MEKQFHEIPSGLLTRQVVRVDPVAQLGKRWDGVARLPPGDRVQGAEK